MHLFSFSLPSTFSLHEIPQNPPFSLPNADLLLLDPRKHAGNDQQPTNNHSPRLHMQYVLRIPRVRRCRCRDKEHQQDKVSEDTVVFVYLLCIVHSAVQLRNKELGEAHEGLNDKQDVRDGSEVGVHGFKVRNIVVHLVV